MKCIKCGNELSQNDQFCGKCGEKVFDLSTGGMNDLYGGVSVNPQSNMPNAVPAGNVLNTAIPKKKNMAILVLAAVLVLLAGFGIFWLVYGNFVAKGFSPMGTWTGISDKDIELEFNKDKSVYAEVEEFGGVSLKWEKADANKLRITGFVPALFYGSEDGDEYREITIDTYAYYDKKDNTLSLELANEVYVLRKSK